MHKSSKPIDFWAAVAMGVGAMVGAGIFALLIELVLKTISKKKTTPRILE